MLTRTHLLIPLLLFFAATACAQKTSFTFSEDREAGRLILSEKGMPVLAFQRSPRLKEGVKTVYRRAGYFHPVYDLDGEPITRDFPEDHYHHRGLWLSWPWMSYRGRKVQLWHPSALRQEFDRYLRRETGPDRATLELRNSWVLEGTSIGSETWRLTVQARSGDRRVIDVQITVRAAEHPIKLRGKRRKKKGYGGLTLRTAPSLAGGRLMTDGGGLAGDTVQEHFQWVDLSSKQRGVALMAHPSNPNAPPPWLLRNSYGGVLNAEWPGLETYTLKPGEPVTLRYRLVVHRGRMAPGTLENVFEEWKRAK